MYFKKIGHFAICVVLLCCCMLFTTTQAMAAFSYRLENQEDGSQIAVLTKYTGSDAEVTVPETFEDAPVTEIGISAFADCTSLSCIKLPATLKVIGTEAFNGCTSLGEIELPDGLEELGSKVFKDSRVAKLYLPDSVEKLSSFAFDGMEATLKELRWTAGIPKLDNSLFQDFTALQKLILPEGVTEIGSLYSSQGTFEDCYGLQQIHLPSTLQTIGAHTFENCWNLASISIPSGVTNIGDYAFSGCSKLQRFEMKSGSAVLCEYAFDNCVDLTKVDLGGISKIEPYAFNMCSALTSITLPAGVKEVGQYAFYRCNKLQSIEIPEGSAKLCNSAFSGNYWLEKADLRGVSVIEGTAFYSCSRLKEVQLGEGLKTLGSGAFTNCVQLKRLYLPDDITKIEGMPHSYGSTTLVARKGTTTASKLRAYSISFVEPVVLQLPADIKQIDAEAFCGSAAEAVVIPEGCFSIGARAFADMPSLHYVVVPESVTKIAEDAFEGSPVMCFDQE